MAGLAPFFASWVIPVAGSGAKSPLLLQCPKEFIPKELLAIGGVKVAGAGED